MVSDVQVMETLATSDNNMMTCEIHMVTSTVIQRQMRFDYNKADFNGFRQELNRVDWDTLLNGDTQDCWMRFKMKIQELEKVYTFEGDQKC